MLLISGPTYKYTRVEYRNRKSTREGIMLYRMTQSINSHGGITSQLADDCQWRYLMMKVSELCSCCNNIIIISLAASTFGSKFGSKVICFWWCRADGNRLFVGQPPFGGASPSFPLSSLPPCSPISIQVEEDLGACPSFPSPFCSPPMQPKNQSRSSRYGMIAFMIPFWWIVVGLSTPIRAWSPQMLLKSNIRLSINHNESLEDEPTLSNDIEVPILYESERILVVNKPSGIAHHNDDSLLGILNIIREQRGERLWGVHRLDRVTSGILIMAKDAAMAQALTASFATGTISKFYLGISKRRPTKKKQGWVQGGMVRSRDKSWKLTKTIGTNFAKTRFFTAPILCNGEKFTLLLFRPYTGKTHQLRVAAKSMGMPLWGDPIYKDGSTEMSDMLPNRTYLHASGIVIPPLLENPESIVLWCPPPFEDILGNTTDIIISNLMRKHCDVPEMLNLVELSS